MVATQESLVFVDNLTAAGIKNMKYVEPDCNLLVKLLIISLSIINVIALFEASLVGIEL